MALFVISYDLHNQRNYGPLIAALEGARATRLLASVWLLQENSTAIQIRDGLIAKLDHDDSVVVLELKPGSMWATKNVVQAGVDWLKRIIMG